ncbi:MAG: CPBP family intramembrane metalloprotease [Clostridia bacterium]|nr:CPBP family intramembrane metalloprotease [Clostridia bacterium]
MKNRKLNIFDAGIAFVMAFVLAQITSVIGFTITEVILDACGMTEAKITAFWNGAFGYLLQAIYMNIGFILVFIYYYKTRQKQPILQRPNQSTLKYVGVCVAIGIATLFLLSGLLNYWQLLIDKLGFTSSSLSYELDSVKNYLISLVSLALIPAVCEELIFRGIITTALKEKGQVFAVVLSSIMFSIFHFSPSQLLYPICFGLILGIVYLKTRNILFPILLHFINNALSLSIQYFSSDTSSVFTHSMMNLIYAIVTFAGWVCIMVYLFKDFKENIATKTNQNVNNNLANEQNIDSVSTNNSTNNNISTQNTTYKSTQDIANDKLNKIVLYGSIALMVVIYLLLLSI